MILKYIELHMKKHGVSISYTHHIIIYIDMYHHLVMISKCPAARCGARSQGSGLSWTSWTSANFTPNLRLMNMDIMIMI